MKKKNGCFGFGLLGAMEIQYRIGTIFSHGELGFE
jgi:hypothetical protein